MACNSCNMRPPARKKSVKNYKCLLVIWQIRRRLAPLTWITACIPVCPHSPQVCPGSSSHNQSDSVQKGSRGALMLWSPGRFHQRNPSHNKTCPILVWTQTCLVRPNHLRQSSAVGVCAPGHVRATITPSHYTFAVKSQVGGATAHKIRVFITETSFGLRVCVKAWDNHWIIILQNTSRT